MLPARRGQHISITLNLVFLIFILINNIVGEQKQLNSFNSTFVSTFVLKRQFSSTISYVNNVFCLARPHKEARD